MQNESTVASRHSKQDGKQNWKYGREDLELFKRLFPRSTEKARAKYDKILIAKYGLSVQDIFSTVSYFEGGNFDFEQIISRKDFQSVIDSVKKSQGIGDQDAVKMLRDLYDNKRFWDSYSKAKTSDYYAEELFLNKIATRVGMTSDQFLDSLQEIYRYQSMSNRKLKPELIPLIKLLTVRSGDLPKVVWRGLYFDGKKIKDKEKFLKKWGVGSKPMVKLGKPTSWSRDRSVAIEFMSDHGSIVDVENGFHVLLRYNEPTKDDVVFDGKNFKWSEYYNQKEVVLSKDAVNYTVEQIIPFGREAGFESFRKSVNRNKHAHTFSVVHSKIMSDIFFYERIGLDADEKIGMKMLLNRTADEIRSSDDVKRLNLSTEYSELYGCLWALYSFAISLFSNVNALAETKSGTLKCDRDVLRFKCMFSNRSNRGPFRMKETSYFEKLNKEMPKIPYMLYEFGIVCKLLKNEMSGFVISVEIGDKLDEDIDSVDKETALRYREEAYKTLSKFRDRLEEDLRDDLGSSKYLKIVFK